MSVSPKGKNEEPSIYIPNSGTNGSHDISIFLFGVRSILISLRAGLMYILTSKVQCHPSPYKYFPAVVVSQSANMIGVR